VQKNTVMGKYKILQWMFFALAVLVVAFVVFLVADYFYQRVVNSCRDDSSNYFGMSSLCGVYDATIVYKLLVFFGPIDILFWLGFVYFRKRANRVAPNP